MVNFGVSTNGIKARIGVSPTSTSDLMWRKSPSVNTIEYTLDLAGVRK
jgi:hypothetical protein